MASGYGIPTTTQISQIHPQGTDIQAPTRVGDLIGLTQTTTTISISGKEDKSNKVTSISASSTDTQYPSAKLLYDQLATKAPASGSGSYIWNQNSSAQTANAWISGAFKTNSDFQTTGDQFIYSSNGGGVGAGFLLNGSTNNIGIWFGANQRGTWDSKDLLS